MQCCLSWNGQRHHDPWILHKTCHSRLTPVCTMFRLAIIIINKVLIKVTLNKVITGALYIVCGWNAVKVQGWQLTVNDDWNRDVFKRRQKHSSDGVSLTVAGRLFQVLYKLIYAELLCCHMSIISSYMFVVKVTKSTYFCSSVWHLCL